MTTIPSPPTPSAPPRMTCSTAGSPRMVVGWWTRRAASLRTGVDRGSATVELALLTPLLIGVLLLVVLCGRLVSAQLDLDAAAHAAARAASLARTPATAVSQARTAATDTLTSRHVTCRQPDIGVNTGGLVPGGVVTVTIACTVPLSDLVLLEVPGSRQAQATAESPIDQWRGQP